MEKSISIFRSLLLFVLLTGMLSSASAQRGYGRNYGGYYRGGGFSYHAPVFRSYSSPYYGVPRSSISINFGGYPYYYSGSAFYRPYGGYYRSVFPPIGIHVGILPFGYLPLYVGPQLYYFNNGSYYRQYNDREYEVVDAPLGAQLASLPKGARSVSVNGEKFYELNGTYYKEDRNSKGNVVYTVTGKNGEIDNTETPAPPADTPHIGDKVNALPDNSKPIILNGQKLFVSPENTYYEPVTGGGYKIVGVPDYEAQQ